MCVCMCVCACTHIHACITFVPIACRSQKRIPGAAVIYTWLWTTLWLLGIKPGSPTEATKCSYLRSHLSSFLRTTGSFFQLYFHIFCSYCLPFLISSQIFLTSVPTQFHILFLCLSENKSLILRGERERQTDKKHTDKKQHKRVVCFVTLGYVACPWTVWLTHLVTLRRRKPFLPFPADINCKYLLG